jgi:anaerobic selenocysteine-containing dehydrogenase
VHERVLPNGCWRVAPAALVAQFAEWSARAPDALVVIPRRAVRRMNSALRDIGRGSDDNAIWIHPSDAGSVRDGDAVRVVNDTGVLVGTARVTTDVVPGAISVSHGLADANVSGITTGARGHTDPLSGMPVQSGVAVSIDSAEPIM